MKHIAGALFLIVSLLLSLNISSEAQLAVAVGTPQFNGFGGGPFDVINLGNLNVHFSVPVLHKAGRGMPFSFDLSYDSSIWTEVTSGGTTTWQPVANYGWKQYPQAGTIQQTSTWTYTAPCNPPYDMHMVTVTYYSGFTYKDSFGTMHYFPTVTTSTGGQGCANLQNEPPSSAGALANDGSGYTMSAYYGTGTVYAASGQTYGSTSTIIDSNGNILSNSTGAYLDTLGQTVVTVAGGAPSPLTLTYTAPSGPAPPVTVTYVTKTVQTNFGCLHIVDPTITNVSLIDRITLADQTYYQFTYETTPGYSGGQVTGRLASITLPTGGTITYAYNYQDGHNGIVCADGSTDGLTRTVNGGTWTYTRTQDPQAQDHWTTKVTTPPDPQNVGSVGDDTVIDFRKDTSGTFNFYEVQRVAYQGSSTSNAILMSTHACYNNVITNCPNVSVSAPIAQTDYYKQPPGLSASLSETKYNAYGLPTDHKDYDYGSALLRDTATTYASLGLIYDHPASIQVTDANNNVLSSTTYTYDEYSSYPLQATSGTPQHGSVGSAPRGNLTTVSSAVSWNPSTHSAGSSLTKHFEYYDTGNVYQSQDVNGQWTTYNYDTTAQGNSTKSCGNSFSTGLTLPISGLSSLAGTTWNCIGGVATQTKDLNGNATNTTYSDPYFWRPASGQDPTLVSTTLTYTPYNSSTQAPATVDSKMLFNSNNSVVELLATKGTYGQELYAQLREGPTSSNYDSVQVLYDTWLRPYQSTMPCVTTAGAGCAGAPKTTSTFDALGRVTNTTDGGGGYINYTYTGNDVLQATGPAPSGESLKQKQLQYDGLGRLTSVCELTSLSGSGTCGQATTRNGYWTKYTYDTTTLNSLQYTRLTITQNAQAGQSLQQSRVYVYDLIGRLVSETNPESGTTQYFYDSAPISPGVACSGTYSGDLVKTYDANGNTVCHVYDAIHRLTLTTYPAGPNLAGTPAKFFAYDVPYYGSTGTNIAGRLVAAGTCQSNNSCAGSSVVLEEFGYSVRGEVTDIWETTPHSSGTYHTTASYWADGALNTLGGVPGQTAWTYTVDSEGRPATAKQGSTNLVTGTTFNAASQPLTITLGLGDTDTYQYDNAGRMKNYNFTVGSTPKSMVGAVNWNPNGSLGSLAITDGFNSGGTQTCKYGDPASSIPGYDDLSRLIKVDCGASIWQQNFSYDAFGNLTKTVPTGGTGLAWNPGYNSANDHYTLAGTSYDANGNLLTDTFHTYTWDAEGHPATIDSSACGTNGTCLIYDALGRMAEKNVSGTYTQVLYSPAGKLAVMNGQTLVNAYVPLPGGATYNVAPGYTRYWHKDWLGTVRLSSTGFNRGVDYDRAFAPFGEVYKNFTNTWNYNFTGDTQDTVANTYDTENRELNPTQGRWLSPDPVGLQAVDPSNPQSWNRYAYSGNNPLTFIDPLGLCPITTYDADGEAHTTDDGLPCAPVTDQGLSFLCAIVGYACGNNGNNYVQGSPTYATGGGSGTACLAGAGPLAAGQSRCAANNGTPQPQQTTQQCLQQGYNSPEGKFVQFLSPLSLIPGWNSEWKENASQWGEAIVGKGTGLAVPQATGFSKATQTVQTISGQTQLATGWFENAVSKVLGVAEDVAPYAGGAAVLGDLLLHAQCSTAGSLNPLDLGGGYGPH